MLQLRRRLDKMMVPNPDGDGEVTALSLLRYIYDDMCCNRGDPAQHPCVRIFPYVSRAPFADGFHKIDLLKRSLNHGASETLKGSFLRDVGAAIRKPCESDISNVKKWLEHRGEKSGRGSSLKGQAADREARTNLYRQHGQVRTEGRPGHEIETALKAHIEQYGELSEAEKTKGLRALFRPDDTIYGTGTKAQAELIYNCCRKGCLTDPLPVDEMYIKYGEGPQTKLPLRISKGQSTKNESLHRLINGLVHNISHVSGELLHKRIMMRIFRYNIDTDRKLGRLQRHSDLPFWLMHDINADSDSVLERIPFSDTELTLKRKFITMTSSHIEFEPQGFEYHDHVAVSRIKDYWAKVKRDDEPDWQEVYAAIEGTLKPAIEPAPPSTPPKKKTKKTLTEKVKSPGLGKSMPPSSDYEIQLANSLLADVTAEGGTDDVAKWNEVASRYNLHYIRGVTEREDASVTGEGSTAADARVSTVTDGKTLSTWFKKALKAKGAATIRCAAPPTHLLILILSLPYLHQ